MKSKQIICIKSVIGITWGHKYTVISESDTGFRVMNDFGNYRLYKKNRVDCRGEVDVEKMESSS